MANHPRVASGRQSTGATRQTARQSSEAHTLNAVCAAALQVVGARIAAGRTNAEPIGRALTRAAICVVETGMQRIVADTTAAVEAVAPKQHAVVAPQQPDMGMHVPESPCPVTTAASAKHARARWRSVHHVVAGSAPVFVSNGVEIRAVRSWTPRPSRRPPHPGSLAKDSRRPQPVRGATAGARAYAESVTDASERLPTAPSAPRAPRRCYARRHRV